MRRKSLPHGASQAWGMVKAKPAVITVTCVRYRGYQTIQAGMSSDQNNLRWAMVFQTRLDRAMAAYRLKDFK